MAFSVRLIRIFLGSPGDVADERRAVSEFIELRNKELKGKVYRLELVAGNEDSYTQVATSKRQTSIDRDLPRPSACDIAIFIFARRIGTDLLADGPDDHRVELGLGDVPLTGSVSELCDALHGVRSGTSHCLPLVFRRTFPRGLDTDDIPVDDEQRRGVQALFAGAGNAHPVLKTVLEYAGIEEFREALQRNIRLLCERLVDGPADTQPVRAAAPRPVVAKPSSRLCFSFVDRDDEARSVNDYLAQARLRDEPQAARARVVCVPVYTSGQADDWHEGLAIRLQHPSVQVRPADLAQADTLANRMARAIPVPVIDWPRRDIKGPERQALLRRRVEETFAEALGLLSSIPAAQPRAAGARAMDRRLVALLHVQEDDWQSGDPALVADCVAFGTDRYATLCPQGLLRPELILLFFIEKARGRRQRWFGLFGSGRSALDDFEALGTELVRPLSEALGSIDRATARRWPDALEIYVPLATAARQTLGLAVDACYARAAEFRMGELKFELQKDASVGALFDE